MKAWQKAACVSLAGAAGALILRAAIKKSPAADTAEKKKVSSVKTPEKPLAEGSYSFVSGYAEAATVNVGVKYDSERFSFSVVEEGFLFDTSDSHVALLFGEDFNAQLEYVPFYQGEDFTALRAAAEKARSGFAPLGEGFRYSDSSSVSVCLPADGSSYLLVSVMLSKGSKLKFEELATADEFTALIGGITVSRS